MKRDEIMSETRLTPRHSKSWITMNHHESPWITMNTLGGTGSSCGGGLVALLPASSQISFPPLESARMKFWRGKELSFWSPAYFMTSWTMSVCVRVHVCPCPCQCWKGLEIAQLRPCEAVQREDVEDRAWNQRKATQAPRYMTGWINQSAAEVTSAYFLTQESREKKVEEEWFIQELCTFGILRIRR